MYLLDLIFPKYCVNCKKYGDYLCPNCFSKLSFDTQNICLPCGKPSYDGLTHPACVGENTISGSFTGVVYNFITKKLLYQFKYKPYLSNLGVFLTDLLYEALIQDENFNRVFKEKNKIILVPIPLSSSKIRKRGYNQAEILAKNLGKRFGFHVYNALLRIKETKSQFSLSKKERVENMKDAFGINIKLIDQIKGKTIFIVDDVLTTGSTLSEAAKVLRKNGAKEVWGIAFAREQ